MALVLFSSTSFSDNVNKTQKAASKHNTSIIGPADASAQGPKTGNPKAKDLPTDGSSDSVTTFQTGGKGLKGSDNAQSTHIVVKRIVGYVVSIDDENGVVVVEQENSKAERKIKVRREALRTLSVGAKVNIELASGTNIAKRINIIAEGKGGAKAEDNAQDKDRGKAK
jgi:hypothetical protein